MMSQPIWITEMSSGAPAMDKLHHAFFAALTQLALAADAEFCVGFSRFTAKIERLFQQEEEWMDEVDFPLFREHQEQHARVLSALHHTAPRVMEGDLALGRQVAENFLPQWLAFHMETMDTALSLAIQIHQSESIPPYITKPLPDIAPLSL